MWKVSAVIKMGGLGETTSESFAKVTWNNNIARQGNKQTKKQTNESTFPVSLPSSSDHPTAAEAGKAICTGTSPVRENSTSPSGQILQAVFLRANGRAQLPRGPRSCPFQHHGGGEGRPRDAGAPVPQQDRHPNEARQSHGSGGEPPRTAEATTPSGSTAGLQTRDACRAHTLWPLQRRAGGEQSGAQPASLPASP